MASTSQTINTLPNWLDGDRIPAAIKLMILEYTSSHQDLLSLIEAYPEWVRPLWNAYPKALFYRAWDNVLNDIHPEVRIETTFVYYIRRMRQDFATAMGSSHESQADRDNLEDVFHFILDSPDDTRPIDEIDPSLDAVLGLAMVVRDVKSLTFRYSNDAWKRIRNIAEETGTGPDCSTDLRNLPAIQLTEPEQFKFFRAFLRVEIYLLTKYWTNYQGERHIFDMGVDVEPFIPHRNNRTGERAEFDSCLRYIFNAHRRHLKKTAKELGAPELPARDDLPWVRTFGQDFDYQCEDYPVPTPDNPSVEFDFAHRSISEEQRFLLWLCEFGIGPLEQTHQAPDGSRRYELLRRFSQREAWDTVELRNIFSRYDLCDDGVLSHLDRYSEDRNRHPVVSLYGRGRHQGYSILPSKWACASEFLTWKFKSPGPRGHRFRGDITLNQWGRWITLSDTDSGATDWNPFNLRGRVHGGGPFGHPYMFDRTKYEFRSLPTRVFLIEP